jgi:hypothetical protein
MVSYNNSNTTRSVLIVDDSGDNEYCDSDTSDFYSAIYLLSDEDLNEMFCVEHRRKTKRHRQIKVHNIKHCYIAKTIIFTRRTMFAKSGYLPWRVRKKVKAR